MANENDYAKVVIEETKPNHWEVTATIRTAVIDADGFVAKPCDVNMKLLPFDAEDSSNAIEETLDGLNVTRQHINDMYYSEKIEKASTGLTTITWTRIR